MQIQTASGSSGAELTIEGYMEFEAIRDFLYAKMRGAREQPAHTTAAAPNPVGAGASEETVALLLAIRDELRATREALAARQEVDKPAPAPAP